MYNRPAENFAFAKDVAGLAERSPLIWALSYIKLPKGAIWTFEDRKWQRDIIEDTHPEIVVIKPTQIGMTTVMTTKVLWFVSYNVSRGMITLPRRDDVTDYVGATLDPMIESSEFLNTKLGKPDTVRGKRLGDSFIHIMEASVTPRMLPVDILANDEVDMSDPDNLEQFVARLDASEYEYHYRFSTPTVSGYGIDAEYERSDQREWVVRCNRCNHDQILDWEINLHNGEDGIYYVCSKCKEMLSVEAITNGSWVAQNEKSDIHGYHVSHMMLPITRPPEKLYEESLVMDRKTFYNLRLGRPWRPVGGSMPPTLFKDNSFWHGHTKEEWRKDKNAKYFLGADQGNDAHVVVGKLVEGQTLEIIFAEHITPKSSGDQFERIGAIMRMFDISYGIIDANPNRVSAYKMCQEFQGKMSACDIGALNYPFKFHGFTGDTAYKVNANRTDLLDGLRDWVSSGKIQFWGRWENREPVIDQMITHCAALKRDTGKKKLQSGGEKVVGIWRKSGHDHFAFALSLLRLAAIIDPGSRSFRFTTIGRNVDDGRKRKSKVWTNSYLPDDEEIDTNGEIPFYMR